MSTMYSRSVVMLEQAKTALAKVSEDDAYLDAALQSSTACHSVKRRSRKTSQTASPMSSDRTTQQRVKRALMT